MLTLERRRFPFPVSATKEGLQSYVDVVVRRISLTFFEVALLPDILMSAWRLLIARRSLATTTRVYRADLVVARLAPVLTSRHSPR